MLILIICILCNVILGILFKLFTRFNINNQGAIVINYFTSVLLASAILGRSPFPEQPFQTAWFPYAVLLGFVFIFGFNIMALTFQKFGIAFTTIIQKMSLIIVVSYAIIVYNESLGPLKFGGLLFALIAIVLVNYTKAIFNKADRKSINTCLLILPLLVFSLSGVIESLLYFLNVEQIVQNGDIRLVSTAFGVAGLLGLFWIYLPGRKNRKSIGKHEFIGGIILGIPNFFTIYLLVVLLNQGWEGSILFPINSIGILLLSVLVGILLFNEKLNTYRIVGVIFSILSIIFIAFAS